MVAELSPDQSCEHALARIRAYAIEHCLTGEHIALIFETGIGPVRYLRPDIFEAAPHSSRQQEAA